jgi:anti-sigma factor RsiW
MKEETVANLLTAVAEEGGPNCQSIETLHEWVTGSLAEGRAATVETHVAQCPRCAAEVRLAGWYEEPADSTDVDAVAAALADAGPSESRPVSVSTRWWGRPQAMAPFALAAMLLVAAGLSLFRHQPPPVGELPSGDAVRGAAPSIVEPRGTLTTGPESIGWTAGAATRYRVELLTVDGTVLWSADVEGDRVDLPAEVRGGLADRVTYRLRVVPLAADAASAGPGDEAEFRIVGDRS